MKFPSLLLSLCLVLGACSHVPPAPVDENRLVLDTLALAQKTAAANAEEQKRELASAQQAYNRERSLGNRLRLGVLLALPQPALEDKSRALALLEPLAGHVGPAGQLATLVQGQLNERLKEGRRAQQLKEQLDELKSIERQLIERSRKGRQ